MSLDNEIEAMLCNTRGSGKTTALVKAAKEHGGTIICHDEKEANRLRKQYDVNAVAITNDRYWYGKRDTIPFVEPDALQTILRHHERDTEHLRRMVQNRGAENMRLRNKLFDTKNTLEEQRRINRLVVPQMKGALAVCWLINSMGQFNHQWSGENE